MEGLSGTRIADAITSSSLSHDEVELVMQRLLEKQDFSEEWEMVRSPIQPQQKEMACNSYTH